MPGAAVVTVLGNFFVIDGRGVKVTPVTQKGIYMYIYLYIYTTRESHV